MTLALPEVAGVAERKAATSLAVKKAATVRPANKPSSGRTHSATASPAGSSRNIRSNAPAKPKGPAGSLTKKSSGTVDTPSIKFGVGVGSTGKYRQILAAEIIVGGIIILLEPSSSQSDTDFAQSAEQLAAFLIAFFILSLMTTAGPNAARISATLGGILVLAILLRPKNINLLTNILPPGFRGARQTTPTTVVPTTPGTATATTASPNINPNSLGHPIGQTGGVYNA